MSFPLPRKTCSYATWRMAPSSFELMVFKLIGTTWIDGADRQSSSNWRHWERHWELGSLKEWERHWERPRKGQEGSLLGIPSSVGPRVAPRLHNERGSVTFLIRFYCPRYALLLAEEFQPLGPSSSLWPFLRRVASS